MMRLKSFKRTEFIIVVFVLCTVNVGCSHIDRQEKEQNIQKEKIRISDMKEKNQKVEEENIDV